jgi:alkaline phosphatase D
MTRLVLAAALAGLALSAGAGAAAGFEQGVAAGEVRDTEAWVWTRAPQAGRVTLQVTRTGSFDGLRGSGWQARAENDRTVTVAMRGLRPGARYRYRFVQGERTSPVGTFVTAPAPDADARVRFAVTGDADATPGTNGKPAFNRFQVYARMARERNDFNVNMGDTIYSDSGVGGAKVARTVAEKHAKYRLGLALPALRTLRAAAGLYSHWDDHEFVNDFSRAEHGEAIYSAGMKAFRDYAPVTYSARTGLYRSFRWGRNLELFFLDERSFRSAKASTVCGNDLAPQAPQSIRAGFAQLAPSLAQPVTQACTDALDSPARTMLGAVQYAAFTRAIKASTATWKVVLNEVPMLQLYALPYDRWEGYNAERKRLLADLASVKNVVFLTTDTHANLIGEVRTSTFDPAGPGNTGIWEVVTGPVATNTYAKEIDRFLGAQGTAGFIAGLFFRPPPPRGLGLQCAALDTYSYAQVDVTATTLTVRPKTAAGAAVRDATGAACAPLVLPAR